MKNFTLLILFAFLLQLESLNAQNREFPNAIQTKVFLADFGQLYDGTPKIGQGFEFGYSRRIAPYLNACIPIKIGLAKLPKTTENTITTSADLIFRIENMKSTGKILPYLFGGAGYFLESFGDGHVQFPFGGGINFRVSPYAFFNLQGEYRHAQVPRRDNLQVGVGFVYLLHKSLASPGMTAAAPADTDKDGTPDASDKCPTQPGPAAAGGCPDADNDGIDDTKDACKDEAGPAATQGCPDYDNDGFADKDDECPTEAGMLKGCPDTDSDGIADNKDKCPKEAGTPENNGCPLTAMKDSDNDGAPDEQDECPITPGTVKGCPDTDKDGTADKDDECPGVPGAIKGCPDADNDGFADKDDECPNVAGALKGCPDADKDGVADGKDKCPDVAGVAENNGCPPEADTDKDGVVDSKDKCPNAAGPESNNGCPVVKDTDGDGVADENDLCPTLAGKLSGCPDADNDGVHDKIDRCPNTAGPASNNGCPEVKAETKERLAFATKAVQFESAKATLKSVSYAVLDTVILILRQYPDYKLAISGYTDNVGSEESNLKLSNDRAKACYDYFIFRGIKADRLRYAGFGPARPIKSNDTAEGREMNRRVEFELMLE